MKDRCKLCGSEKVVKNGFVRGVQRYKCRSCNKNYVIGDRRSNYDNLQKNLVIRMYLNNCGFRRISEILGIPLSTVFYWVKNAGKTVDEMIKCRQDSERKIDILEMDELYSFVKKNQKEMRKPGKEMENTPEFGLLWIGTDLKLLRLN